jgi:hypothetical protein
MAPLRVENYVADHMYISSLNYSYLHSYPFFTLSFLWTDELLILAYREIHVSIARDRRKKK